MTESIWHDEANINIDELNTLHKDTVCELLDIQFTELGSNYVRGTMPADKRTYQPMGLVHGGANVVLAETLGSIAANLVVDTSKYYCVGQEVNANHVRGVRKGLLTGTATLVYKGRTSQVWDIRIEDDRGKLSCISRLTMAVVKHA